MKAVQAGFRATIRAFSTPKTVENILHGSQVDLGLASIGNTNDSLLKLLADRHEVYTPLSVNDCIATRRVVLGLATLGDLTEKQVDAYEKYVTPSSKVQAAQDKGIVVDVSKALQQANSR